MGSRAGGVGLRSVPVSTTGLLASQGLISTTRHRPPTTHHYDRYIHTRIFFIPLDGFCITKISFKQSQTIQAFSGFEILGMNKNVGLKREAVCKLDSRIRIKRISKHALHQLLNPALLLDLSLARGTGPHSTTAGAGRGNDS